MEPLTHANRIHQSSHPTLLTIQILVANRSTTRIMQRTVTKIVVAKRPAEAFLSPNGGGVLGWETMIGATNCRELNKLLSSNSTWSWESKTLLNSSSLSKESRIRYHSYHSPERYDLVKYERERGYSILARQLLFSPHRCPLVTGWVMRHM